MRIGKKIKTEQDRAKELAKERKKRRKHLIKTKYGHKALKHSRKGKLSCVFAGIGIGLWILLVLIAFLKKWRSGNFSRFGRIWDWWFQCIWTTPCLLRISRKKPSIFDL